MADIAPKLVELSADKLRSLHERLHKSEATPATIEVHHLTTTEMLRRGMERPADDAWDEFEIQVDYVTDVDLNSFSSSLPLDLIQEVIKETGSSIGNVRLLLTTDGYQMRIDPVEEMNKMLRQENGKWVVYNEDGTRKFGTYPTKAEAQKRLDQMHQFSKADNTPPKAVRDAARRALDWIAEGKAGSGFTSVGRTRAGQLASGENISIETLKRMKSFFARHEVDKNAIGFSQGEKGYPSAGRVAWDAWGGDAGYAWAESMVARDEKEKEVAKHNQGKHDQKTHGSWANDVADAINSGKHPSIEAENVTAFLMGAAKRTDHPDLTELKVNGTMLFGDEGKGIARKDMPQIPSERRGEFLADLAKDGVTVSEEAIDPKTLKPIQKEVSSARSGAIYNKYREAGAIPQEQRILISKDGFVIDGHHTWGAAVGFSFDNKDAKLPVYRLSLNADEALSASLDWAKSQGIEGQAIDAPTKKALIWEPLEKHGTHDQRRHGSWANGELAADTPASSKHSEAAVREAQNLRARSEAVEPSITALMQNIGGQIGGEFSQLNQRLKSTDSLARKIDADAEKQYDGDREKAASEISDAIRYTLKISDDGYTDGVLATRDVLKKNGFEIRTKNFWESGDPYDGVNIKATKDGVKVEIQLHTPSSLNTKTKELHKIYEGYRKEVNNSKRKTAWDSMVSIAKKIPRPANMDKLLAVPDLTMQQFETAQQAGLSKSTPVDIMQMRGGQE